MIDNIKLKNEIIDLKRQVTILEKQNENLNFLVNNQDRLIKKLNKAKEEYMLLLDEILKKEKEND